MINPLPRLAREVQARHERLSAHDEVLREIREAEGIDPDLGDIELTPAEVAAMTDAGEVMAEATWPTHTCGNAVPDSALAGSQYDPIPRNYRRRTHAEVDAAAYERGRSDRDKLAQKQAEAWHSANVETWEQYTYKLKVAFIAGAVGGAVLMAAVWLMIL
jgi:hypothetical protein